MKVLIRSLSSTFASRALRHESQPISQQIAEVQHAEYIHVFRALLGNNEVFVLPRDDRFPDSNFVEDSAVYFKGTALICRSGAPSRRGEEQAVHRFFQILGKPCVAMETPATLDGGDVLCIGEFIFVGSSSRTNQEGIDTLRRTFPEAKAIIPVSIQQGLHLKSLVTAIHLRPQAPDETPIAVLLSARTQPGISAAEAIRIHLSATPFRVIHVPLEDPLFANVISFELPQQPRQSREIAVIVQAGFPASLKNLTDTLHTVPELHQFRWRLHQLNMQELAKADGALTCCSILIPDDM